MCSAAFSPEIQVRAQDEAHLPACLGPPSAPSQEDWPQGGSGLGSGSRETVHRVSETDGLWSALRGPSVGREEQTSTVKATLPTHLPCDAWGPSREHLLEPEPLEDSKSR